MFKVLDLFSGSGGMSYGFHSHPDFEVVGAVDRQSGKPSSKPGSLECNKTYAQNIGFEPFDADLFDVSPEDIATHFNLEEPVDVLISCAPCTGFSRMNANNHLNDDRRNSLVVRSGDFVEFFKPDIFLMENARELLKGNFGHHYAALKLRLEALGYSVYSKVHMLNKYGLPQLRERSLIIARKEKGKIYSLDDIWSGFKIKSGTDTVRKAISCFEPLNAGGVSKLDPDHASPGMGEANLNRLSSVPKDGGSWVDLYRLGKIELLTPGMRKLIDEGKLGSYPDIYGRMAWDEPARTIKRESAHIGNGRYAHPEQNRLCSVREMATLQGYPTTFKFKGSLSNRYRHVGDAVPPLISRQIAAACNWMLQGRRPTVEEFVLEGTSLKVEDVVETQVCKSEFLQLKLA